VSQWNSSSDNRPSAWLWEFVSGASMKRFFIAGPRAKGSSAKRFVTGALSVVATPFQLSQRRQSASSRCAQMF
jgi:hypothetical protein